MIDDYVEYLQQLNSNLQRKGVETNVTLKEATLDKDVNTLVISYKDELVNYNLFHSNVIDINFIDAEYIFVMGLSSDLKYKTKIMFIDKNTNDMEVL